MDFQERNALPFLCNMGFQLLSSLGPSLSDFPFYGNKCFQLVKCLDCRLVQCKAMLFAVCIFLQHNVNIQIYMLYMHRHQCTHIPSEMQVFELTGQFFSSVVQRCGVHVFQNQFKILMCLNTEQFYTLTQSNLNELWPREDRVSVIVQGFGYFEFSGC